MGEMWRETRGGGIVFRGGFEPHDLGHHRVSITWSTIFSRCTQIPVQSPRSHFIKEKHANLTAKKTPLVACKIAASTSIRSLQPDSLMYTNGSNSTMSRLRTIVWPSCSKVSNRQRDYRLRLYGRGSVTSSVISHILWESSRACERALSYSEKLTVKTAGYFALRYLEWKSSSHA